MCGIAGIFNTEVINHQAILAAQNCLIARGPDVQSYVTWDGNGNRVSDNPVTALIHTRLSIRDLNARANQPMSDASGQVWICYNGEVYGWEEDKSQLESEGYAFYSNSDTEYILNAYLRYGKDFLKKLRGMFAFCILDLRINKAFLARDRMGQKPLYYSMYDENFVFGSTFRSVWTLIEDSQKKLNPCAIDAYLAHRYIPAPQTLCKNVFKLENGHFLEWDLGSKTLNKGSYWNPYESSTGDWKEIFPESVNLRTASDRPVGVFLSGGVDSTAIASILSQHGHKDITAFTASFGDSRFDESHTAKKTANELGLPIREIKIPADISLKMFDKIVDDIDEPFADPSSFPTWLLCRETAKHVTVVLGGDGGDELFAGYKRYKKHLKSAWKGNLKLPGSPFSNTDNKYGKIFSEMKMSWEDAYSLRFSGFSPSQRQALIPNLEGRKNTYWRSGQLQIQEDKKPLGKLLNNDYANYLPEYILKKGDLCSMAHGLELRCPFMDHNLFASLQNMPEEQRFSTPAKQALAQISPQVDHVFHLKKKGFNPPLTHWLKDSWKARYPGLGTRLSSKTKGLICADGADKLISSYLDGRESLAERVLQLLILDRVLETYF